MGLPLRPSPHLLESDPVGLRLTVGVQLELGHHLVRRRARVRVRRRARVRVRLRFRGRIRARVRVGVRDRDRVRVRHLLRERSAAALCEDSRLSTQLHAPLEGVLRG